MGGMISARYALTFPSQTSRLILVAPLGLEDWQALGVSYQRPDQTFITELATTYTRSEPTKIQPTMVDAGSPLTTPGAGYLSAFWAANDEFVAGGGFG
ncbi:hypothetical protein DID88_007033 [Monilinia fructigena]|uniref:AB hydrolase-1 domain-containing protein n=1 Tax=Monilinia fructigena TaxID=38457 RepID=A0A395J9I8_9HELO|nr:hypothetical protein DID88_007033 [Monilinia fructigena]